MFKSSCVEVTTAYASLYSDTLMDISTDSSNASIVEGLTVDGVISGWQVEPTLGALRNVSGRTLVESVGLLSLHTTSISGSDKLLYTYSETSVDNGVTWRKNDKSGRLQSVRGQSEQFGSKSSEGFNIPDDAMVRFRFYTDGAGVSFTPVSFVVDGETISGPSLRWRLEEVRLT